MYLSCIDLDASPLFAGRSAMAGQSLPCSSADLRWHSIPPSGTDIRPVLTAQHGRGCWCFLPEYLIGLCAFSDFAAVLVA